MRRARGKSVRLATPHTHTAEETGPKQPQVKNTGDPHDVIITFIDGGARLGCLLCLVEAHHNHPSDDQPDLGEREREREEF